MVVVADDLADLGALLGAQGGGRLSGQAASASIAPG
jgi:hypothetical protein